jgi:hypothetical protein
LAEIEATGFEIFRTRVAALGLSEFQNRRLFYQSSDYVKYASHGTAEVSGLCSAGYAEDGVTLRVFIDEPCETIASHLLRTNERLDDLRPLLAEARRELKRTKAAA